MLKAMIHALMVSALLTGCDIESFDQLVGGKKPFVVLGAGTEVRISDSETVTVFGSDLCPHSNEKGCVALSGGSVEVFLKYESGPFVTTPFIEEWKVEQSGDKLTLTRPNGYQIEQP